MARHEATIAWTLDGGDFLEGRYSRAHTWAFDGGANSVKTEIVVAAPHL